MLLLIAPPGSFLYSALLIGLFSSFPLLAGFFILNRLSLLPLVHFGVAVTFSPILAATWGYVLKSNFSFCGVSERNEIECMYIV